MLLQGNQGQIGKAVGQNLTVGLGEFTEVLITELMGRYYEQTYRGNKFSATFTAAALAAAASAASFVLINPPNSGKNLVLQDSLIAVTAYAAQTLAGTAVVLGGSPNFTSPATGLGTVVTPANTMIGNANKSVALAYATATLVVVPVAVRQLAAWCLGTATPGADFVSSVRDEIAGEVIVQPGSAVAIFGLGGTVASTTIQPTLTWDEIVIV